MFKPSCCYFSSWPPRTLGAKIIAGLGILIAIGFGLGLILFILSVITYVTQHIITMNILPNDIYVCDTNHDIFFNCILAGLMIFCVLILNVILISALCWPIYKWLYKRNYYLGITLLSIGLLLVYFFGPELGGVLLYQMFYPLLHPLGVAFPIKCELSSWGNFMTFQCFFQGVYVFLMLWVLELICIGFYYLVRCIRRKCDMCGKYFETPNVKLSEQANYGAIPSDHDSITDVITTDE